MGMYKEQTRMTRHFATNSLTTYVRVNVLFSPPHESEKGNTDKKCS